MPPYIPYEVLTLIGGCKIYCNREWGSLMLAVTMSRIIVQVMSRNMLISNGRNITEFKALTATHYELYSLTSSTYRRKFIQIHQNLPRIYISVSCFNTILSIGLMLSANTEKILNVILREASLCCIRDRSRYTVSTSSLLFNSFRH